MKVAAIGPAYTDYCQLIIDNDLSGDYIASKSENDLTSALSEIGISKRLHISRIMNLFSRLKSGEEAALAT